MAAQMTSESPAARAARLSLLAGVAVFALKLGGYALTGSVGLLSDALESTVNIAAALLLGLSVRFAARPADASHPYGHAKAEYVSSFAEGLLIGVAGALIVEASVGRLLHPEYLEFSGSAVALTVLASAINAAVGTYLVRVGRAQRSVALEGDGHHVLSDVWSSAAVLAGVLVAMLTGWSWLDPLVGLAVALGILVVAWRVVRRSLGGLLDETLPAGEVERLRAAIERHRGAFLEYHDLRTRRAGRAAFVDFHLVLPGALPLQAAHDLMDDIEASIHEVLPDVSIVIHVEPEAFAQGTKLDLRL
ncbi:cation diffusion facilitator family transporter [Deinococcus maricopensis DSM 21211]|uniref:Cation diffusion facilitator family transporter n=2 Tax=Deinococcus TaxID=1298 RepID=E8UAK8_DEIML|nr:cation diffusion facilitator family transporter [Deinococcus maricopensis DSM 21211]